MTLFDCILLAISVTLLLSWENWRKDRRIEYLLEKGRDQIKYITALKNKNNDLFNKNRALQSYAGPTAKTKLTQVFQEKKNPNANPNNKRSQRKPSRRNNKRS